MTNYTDYDFYINTYNGSLNATLFNSLITEASLIVKNYINCNLEEIPDEVQFVTCKVVDIIYKRSNTNNGVSSITIDGVSKTYSYNQEQYATDLENALNYLPQELTRYL